MYYTLEVYSNTNEPSIACLSSCSIKTRTRSSSFVYYSNTISCSSSFVYMFVMFVFVCVRLVNKLIKFKQTVRSSSNSSFINFFIILSNFRSNIIYI